MEKECVVFMFNDNVYDLEKVVAYSLETCLSYENPLKIKDFEELYNSPDCSDWGTDDYIRIFTFEKNVQVYIITDEASCPVIYTDGQLGEFVGTGIFFEDENHDGVALEDVPIQILDDLCERTSFMKKVSVEEYEQLHNEQEWPMYVTFRKMES